MLLTLPFAVAVALTTAAPDAAHEKDPAWADFKAKYQKTYKDAGEERERHVLFTATQSRVAELNKLNGGVGHEAFGITWMADRHEHEKHAKGLVKPKGFVPTAPVKDYKGAASLIVTSPEISEAQIVDIVDVDAPVASPAPSSHSVDWRKTRAVTPIKNQGQCGSCWAFSATEAIESQLVLSSGGLLAIDLAPQQVASCAPSTGTYGCLGCNGGFTEGAYDYIKSAPGLANSFYIPYEQSLTEQTPTATCPAAKVDAMTGQTKQLTGGYAAISGYHYAVSPCTEGECKAQDLGALAAALDTTPVSVCVNAGTWNDYTGGVMSAAACGSMGAASQDHCVMAVGYNKKAPTP